MKTLLPRMEELYSNNRQRFDKMKEILEEEFGYNQEKISRQNMMKELYRGSKRYLSSLRGGGGRFRFLIISDTLLLPARKNKQKEWLDTPVVLDEKGVEYRGENRISTNVMEAIPQLWQKKCGHALIKGDGGMGKTVSFIRLWEQYIIGDNYNPLLPVPVFIPLNEYNETNELERKDFIQRLIRRFYLEGKSREKDLLDVFREPLKKGKNGVPSVLLMLDGLNEVTVDQTGLLVELREIIEHWQGVQLLISSRHDMRDTMDWRDFHLLELVGLYTDKIDKYLDKFGINHLDEVEEDSENALWGLLQNPMMLTIYIVTCEVVKEYGGSSLYDFRQKVETPGELLLNFVEAQVVKYFQHSAKNEQQRYYYKFLLKILLPAIGYEMEKTGQFQLNGNELDSLLERYLKRFCQVDFVRTFREYRGYTDNWSINGCEPKKVIEKVERILNIISGEISMLVKEGHSYRFLHQNFRDFFAAVHILNEVEMGLGRKEVTEVLTEGMIATFPQRFMAEIEGEHYCMPHLGDGKGWRI